jgi:hypothetical protein
MNLINLPVEILFEIIKFMRIYDIKNFYESCIKIRNILRNMRKNKKSNRLILHSKDNYYNLRLYLNFIDIEFVCVQKRNCLIIGVPENIRNKKRGFFNQKLKYKKIYTKKDSNYFKIKRSLDRGTLRHMKYEELKQISKEFTKLDQIENRIIGMEINLI